MIGYLEGKIIDLTPVGFYMDVNGVGYEVQITTNTYHEIKDKKDLKIYTHLQVREDAWTLYGFSNIQEKAIFQQLISVSGVGTNTARIMLSSVTYSEMSQIIHSGDTKSLEKIKGIGGKTAQRIILELKGKINLEETTTTNQKSTPKYNTTTNDSLNALIGLGISKAAAEQSINKVALQTNMEQLTTEEIIKLALKHI